MKYLHEATGLAEIWKQKEKRRNNKQVRCVRGSDSSEIKIFTDVGGRSVVLTECEASVGFGISRQVFPDNKAEELSDSRQINESELYFEKQTSQ